MFQNLSIEGNAIDLDPRLEQLKPEDPLCVLTGGVRRIVYMASNVYRGFFIAMPQFLYKGRPDEVRLRWFDDYFEDDPDEQEWQFRPIDFRPDELERYIRQLSPLIGDTKPSRGPHEGPVSYDCVMRYEPKALVQSVAAGLLISDDPPIEPKALVQSLAVEILMCADRYAGAALAGNLLRAAEWMQQTYVLMDELTALALMVARRGKL